MDGQVAEEEERRGGRGQRIAKPTPDLSPEEVTLGSVMKGKAEGG